MVFARECDTIDEKIGVWLQQKEENKKYERHRSRKEGEAKGVVEGEDFV